MDIAISEIPTSQQALQAARQGGGLDRLSGEDFMNILVKQLQFQDPFEPMGNEEMLSQISTIRELEMNTRLSQRLERVADEQRFGSAASLIGKLVVGEVADKDGNAYTMEGVVTGVRFTQDGSVLLELDTGQVLPLSNVQRVAELTPGGADGVDSILLPQQLVEAEIEEMLNGNPPLA